MKRHARTRDGFTLIEALVSVSIIGVLAAISLPNMIGAQNKARIAQVRSNMHAIQAAVETSAIDAAGNYPATVNGIAAYMPGGSNTANGSPGVWPINPMLNSDHPGVPDPPDDATSITDVQASRNLAAGSYKDDAGGIVYDHALWPNSYAIWGCDDAGNCLSGYSGHQLILSNQG